MLTHASNVGNQAKLSYIHLTGLGKLQVLGRCSMEIPTMITFVAYEYAYIIICIKNMTCLFSTIKFVGYLCLIDWIYT